MCGKIRLSIRWEMGIGSPIVACDASLNSLWLLFRPWEVLERGKKIEEES